LIRAYLRNKILSLVLIITLAGCGIKGNPVAYSNATDLKPQVNNLEAASTADSVLLKWNFQDRSGLVKYINIERSEAGSTGNECKDCPRQFDKIGEITVNGQVSKEKGKKKLLFNDKKAVREKIYSYRLKLCDNNNNCSESATVEIKYQ
jgi:hypothetical protein